MAPSDRGSDPKAPRYSDPKAPRYSDTDYRYIGTATLRKLPHRESEGLGIRCESSAQFVRLAASRNGVFDGWQSTPALSPWPGRVAENRQRRTHPSPDLIRRLEFDMDTDELGVHCENGGGALQSLDLRRPARFDGASWPRGAAGEACSET